MKVTERDIFNFVFFPESVREELKAFLSSIEDSSVAVIFYKEMKSALDKEISPLLKERISKKKNLTNCQVLLFYTLCMNH
ncbi:MAG: hypothetical protein IPJ23_19025 [Ignavibacteriales bacterium]|nr:hypothetical protein [Ignavibacteriales bacterium]